MCGCGGIVSDFFYTVCHAMSATKTLSHKCLTDNQLPTDTKQFCNVFSIRDIRWKLDAHIAHWQRCETNTNTEKNSWQMDGTWQSSSRHTIVFFNRLLIRLAMLSGTWIRDTTYYSLSPNESPFFLFDLIFVAADVMVMQDARSIIWRGGGEWCDCVYPCTRV